MIQTVSPFEDPDVNQFLGFSAEEVEARAKRYDAAGAPHRAERAKKESSLPRKRLAAAVVGVVAGTAALTTAYVNGFLDEPGQFRNVTHDFQQENQGNQNQNPKMIVREPGTGSPHVIVIK